jgi:hypothetical protein
VFVFHTVDAHTHALAQNSRRDKTTPSVCAQLRQACAGGGSARLPATRPRCRLHRLGQDPGGMRAVRALGPLLGQRIALHAARGT